MKYTSKNIAMVVALFIVLAGIGMVAASIGRFTPTHKIVEPVYCGACHVDQVVELNATTHLPHFAGAVYEEAEAIGATVSQAEAVSSACMMCHNTWANRDRIYVNGYELATDGATGESILRYNDISVGKAPTNDSVLYDVVVTSGTQVIRLGDGIVTTGVKAPKITVQVPGDSGLVVGTIINGTASTTGVTFSGDTNAAAIATNGTGAVKITYTVNTGQAVSLKTVWGNLSARSPTLGAFYNGQTGAVSCGNVEKGFCHAVEIASGKNIANQMAENRVGGSGNGVYFQHEMGYTSTDAQAKQVKLCGVCHVNKLPPMEASGEPMLNAVTLPTVIRNSHGAEILNTTITYTGNEWTHKQIQCIKCHEHAGIGSEISSN